MADHDDHTTTTTTTMEHWRMSPSRLAPIARHAAGLRVLMEQRRDLRGVYALADHVDDAVRWSA